MRGCPEPEIRCRADAKARAHRKEVDTAQRRSLRGPRFSVEALPQSFWSYVDINIQEISLSYHSHYTYYPHIVAAYMITVKSIGNGAGQ